MRKIIFGTAVSVCCCFSPAFVAAADTTWFCSALMSKTDKKPTAFKFVVKGDELIEENVWPDAFFKKWELQRIDVPVTKYKIVKDTEKSLIAIHGDDAGDNETSAMVVVIDKVSSEFRQIAISTKASDPWPNFEGTCSR